MQSSHAEGSSHVLPGRQTASWLAKLKSCLNFMPLSQ